MGYNSNDVISVIPILVVIIQDMLLFGGQTPHDQNRSIEYHAHVLFVCTRVLFVVDWTMLPPGKHINNYSMENHHFSFVIL